MLIGIEPNFLLRPAYFGRAVAFTTLFSRRKTNAWSSGAFSGHSLIMLTS